MPSHSVLITTFTFDGVTLSHEAWPMDDLNARLRLLFRLRHNAAKQERKRRQAKGKR